MSLAPHSVRVLIAEDTASLLRLYSHVLSQAGYHVLHAGSGIEAQQVITAEHPHIVLLDRVLPDIDGSAVCAWIKQTPELASTYVVMLSAIKTSEAERASGLEAGADDYMVKPIDRRELLARVQVAVRLKSAQLALHASEIQFRTLAENLPDAIMRTDRSGLPLYMSPGIQKILGVTREAISTDSCAQLGIPDEIAAAWYNTCAQVVETGKTQRLEAVFESRGQTRYVEAQLVPEYDPEGQVSSLLAVLRDTSEHVRSRQAIARLAAVVEQTVEAVIITDHHGVVQYVNAAFERLTGFLAQETAGHRLEESYWGKDGLARELSRAIEAQEPWEGVAEIRHKDGRPCQVEATVFPIIDPQPGALSFVALLRDLTERRRAEREREVVLKVASALRKASTRAEMVPIILDEILVLFDVVATAFVSPDAQTGDVLIEMGYGDFAHLTGRRIPLASSLTAQALASNGPYLVNDLGSVNIPSWLEIPGHIRAMLGVPLIARTRPIGVIWIGSDVPIQAELIGRLATIADIAANALDRAALYQELERYAADLEVRVAERTRELADANDRLLELDRLKSKFVSDISHDLRTPISNLKLYMSLLQRGKPERRAHYEAMLQTSVERLGQLVEDILNLSRLERAHLLPREFALTDLNAIVAQVVHLHQPQAEAAGLSLLFEPDPTLPLIHGDYNQLAQLVTNLVANALSYTRRGYVRVAAQPAERPGMILLAVEDTGVGILPEDFPHLFERFYRGNHRQAQDIPGTGLGLAIVQEIVGIHRGEVAVYSEVDVGTRVEVCLPVVQPESDT